GLAPKSLRVAIQGFGSVGRSAATDLVASGFRIVAVADIRGVVYRPHGLDVGELDRARDPWGLVDRRQLDRRYDLRPGSAWPTLEAEVLIPAAVEDAITARELPGLSPRLEMVVEGANGPITREAEELLERRGVAVVPDVIASAGAAAAFG